jgi:ribonuclease HI
MSNEDRSSGKKMAIELYTDGACSGNPGPGGWGAILISGKHRKELSGYEANTTNNRMELTAVIAGLQSLKKSSSVALYSDSQYVLQGLESWMANWKKNGWRTSNKKPVKNVDLWQALDVLLGQHHVTFHWIRGHSGHLENERADQLAVEAYRTAPITTRDLLLDNRTTNPSIMDQ